MVFLGVKPEKALADHDGDNITTYCSQPIREIFQTQALYFDPLREPNPVIDNVSNTTLASVAAINRRQVSTSSPQRLYNLATMRIVVHMMSSLPLQQRDSYPCMSHGSM